MFRRIMIIAISVIVLFFSFPSYAANDNSAEIASCLIEHGASVKAKGPNKETPLDVAIYAEAKGEKEEAKEYLEKYIKFELPQDEIDEIKKIIEPKEK